MSQRNNATAPAVRPVSRIEAAEFFDVHPSTICAWVKRGFPLRPDGKVNLQAAVQWYACFLKRDETWRDEALRRHIKALSDR